MKKLFWFFIISVLVLLVSLVFTNWQTIWKTIWKTIINFPINLIVAYIFGAVCMFIAEVLSGDKGFRKKHTSKQN